MGRIPAYVTRRNDRIWTTTLSAGRILYVGYNEVQGNTDPTAQRVLKAAKSKKLRAVVVDVRNNGGGDNRTYKPLLNVLIHVAKTKRVIVLISRTTFSAAENFITERRIVRAPGLRRRAERREPEPLRRHNAARSFPPAA